MASDKENNTKKGSLGERITESFLKNKGFLTICRNFSKRWGEIDIVMEKDNLLHFIEVKSVSCENPDFGPENNMHKKKRTRLSKIINTYLTESEWRGDWQVDLALVHMNIPLKKAKIELLENIEL